MTLSCSCDFEDWEPGDIMVYAAGDYSILATTRRKRCSSCGILIDIGATVAKFDRGKMPGSDIECRIYGEDDEIELAPQYLCEECADIYFSLKELGFSCVWPDENMRALAKEYAETYGPENVK